MFNSFKEVLQYVSLHQLLPQFRSRIGEVYKRVGEGQWPNEGAFTREMEVLDGM